LAWGPESRIDKPIPDQIRLGRPPIPAELEGRIRAALAKPGRPGVRRIAAQFGVNPSTVQRISRPFEKEGAGAAAG